MKNGATHARTVQRLLRQARHRLSPQSQEVPTKPSQRETITGDLQEFEEFLEHNELELAWDALYAVARRNDADADCWALMAEAAIRMGLSDKAVRAVKNAAKARQRTGRRAVKVG